MNNKIASAKKFVKKHKTAIALTTGVVAGSAITFVGITRGRSLLAVTDETVRLMRDEDVAIHYETPHGRITTIMNTQN